MKTAKECESIKVFSSIYLWNVLEKFSKFANFLFFQKIKFQVQMKYEDVLWTQTAEQKTLHETNILKSETCHTINGGFSNLEGSAFVDYVQNE